MKIPRHIYDQFARAVHVADAAPIGQPFAVAFLVIPLAAPELAARHAIAKLVDDGSALVQVMLIEPEG